MNLTNLQKDALIELLNVGLGHAANVLSKMINSTIHLRVPSIYLLSKDQSDNLISQSNQDNLSSVQLDFNGDYSGMVGMLFPTESANALVNQLIDQDSQTDEIDEMKIGALTELGNIILNAVMGSISNVIKSELSFSIPKYTKFNLKSLINQTIHSNVSALFAEAQFDIQSIQINGNLILIFELQSFDKLLKQINSLYGV